MSDASALLDATLGSLGGGLPRIVDRWRGAVGEQVAAVTLPVRLREGTLTVRCSSSAWTAELAMRHSELLRNLAAALGDGSVRELKLVTGRVAGMDEASAGPGAAPKPPEPVQADPELQRQMAERAAQIRDPRLRALAARAAAATIEHRQDA